MAAEIHDCGRGPEITGTRITVYDILDYEHMGWPPERTAEWLKLTLEQVQAARDYIRGHGAQITADYEEMLRRGRLGNPPQLRARLDAARDRLTERKRELVRLKAGGGADARSVG